MEKPISVTYASVPDKRRFLEYVEDILETRWFTNGGRYVRDFEKQLGEMLGAPPALCNNGTLALQLAIRAAGLSGKTVVTTPFTYVATLSALLWEGCTPVFADIDEHTLCLSPESLAALDLSHVKGLLPVHPYGNACDIEALGKIADEASLFTIYDAAQAFGCLYRRYINSKRRTPSLFCSGWATILSILAFGLSHWTRACPFGARTSLCFLRAASPFFWLDARSLMSLHSSF